MRREKLILLHGLGGTGNLWRPIAASLEDEFDLLCPDQRGHGQSIPPANDWNFAPLDYARDVEETALHHGHSPAWVIGHSMGVRTALGYAKLDPSAVKGLLLVDLGFSGLAGGGLGPNLAAFLRVLPESFASRAEARAFLLSRCPDPAIGQYLLAVSVPTPEGGVRFPFSHPALLQTIEQARDSENFPALETFARATGRPVRILRGERSLVYSAAAFAADRARAGALPNVEFHELAGAGHGLPFEKRAEFVAMVREWISPR